MVPVRLRPIFRKDFTDKLDLARWQLFVVVGFGWVRFPFRAQDLLRIARFMFQSAFLVALRIDLRRLEIVR